MYKKSIFTACCILIGTVSMAQQLLEDQLLGTWYIEQVLQQGKEVSAEHNPKDNRYIAFNNLGTFESGGDPYGQNSGAFYVNNFNATLHLDSDAGPEDDSYWSVTFENGTMTWKGMGSEFARGFVIVYRAKE